MNTKETIQALAGNDDVDLVTRRRIFDALRGKEQGKTVLLTTKQAAELLEVHVVTLRRYERDGLLSPVRYTARRIRWKKNELEEFLTKGAEASHEA